MNMIQSGENDKAEVADSIITEPALEFGQRNTLFMKVSSILSFILGVGLYAACFGIVVSLSQKPKDAKEEGLCVAAIICAAVGGICLIAGVVFDRYSQRSQLDLEAGLP